MQVNCCCNVRTCALDCSIKSLLLLLHNIIISALTTYLDEDISVQEPSVLFLNVHY